MKPTVNQETCIGCGTCESICPNVFKVNNGKAVVDEGADFSANEDCIKEAAEACPVNAISIE